MTKRIQAKHKIDRRLGENIWGRPKSPFNKRAYGPGQHGKRRKGKATDFGTQLMAKQKLKGYYANIGERRFRRYYFEAARMKGDTSVNLIGILEQRLDAIIYRAKFAITMFAARQLISHGHVLVNGRKARISSMILKPGAVVEVREKSKNSLAILDAVQTQERDVPDYVLVDNEKLSATFSRIPSLDEVPYPVQMEPNLVIEYYSR